MSEAEPSTVLVLRTCAADMSSHNGFVWPESGAVKCDYWDPYPRCGSGLHGFLRGEGAGSLADWAEDAKWLVVEVPAAAVVDLGGKVKFPHGNVIFCGERSAAVELIQARYPSAAVIAGTATAGPHGTATAGYAGTATAGYGGTATAGDHGSATAGDHGIIAIKRWTGKRYKLVVGHIGEDGLEPNVPYKLDNAGCFIRAARKDEGGE